jgi:hypothetical protein
MRLMMDTYFKVFKTEYNEIKMPVSPICEQVIGIAKYPSGLGQVR